MSDELIEQMLAAQQTNFIQLSRIYDVLFAQFTAAHPEAASRLAESHARGIIVSPMPAFVGNFMYNVVNETELSDE